MSYISHLSEVHDILSVCEHWLGEMSSIVDKFSGHWCHMKSSVCPETTLVGWPYGGTGFLCTKAANKSYKAVCCESDRICGVDTLI